MRRGLAPVFLEWQQNAPKDFETFGERHYVNNSIYLSIYLSTCICGVPWSSGLVPRICVLMAELSENVGSNPGCGHGARVLQQDTLP